MARRYPKEVHDFIRENVEGRTTRDLTALVNETFNVGMTEAQMKSYKQNHKLKSGTPGGLPKGHYSDTFPEPVAKYIQKHHKGVGNKEMAERLNRKFGTSYTTKQLNAYYKNHGLNSGLTGRFEKGHVPANKGTHPPTTGRMAETQFKKGNLPHNTKPVGYERISRDGYIEVKIKMRPSRPDCNDNFKAKHILVWEAANGPVPEGHVLIFKDGNKMNVALENLALVTKAEHLELTRSGLRSTDPDITETGRLIARIKCTSRKKQKKLKQGGQNNGKEELPHD